MLEVNYISLPDSSGYVADDFMEKVFAFRKDGEYVPVGVITAVDITDRSHFKFSVMPFDKIPHNAENGED